MLEKTLELPHPVIFIVDPTQDSEIPPDVSVAVVTTTPTCVTVWAISEADDPVTIRLGPQMEKAVGTVVFDGTLQTPGRKIEVQDSGLDAILETDVPNDVTRLTIWVNNPEWPDLIEIRFR
jgi:hypothetical protein